MLSRELMADDRTELEELQRKVGDIFEKLNSSDFIEDIGLLQDVYYIWSLWADFHLFITFPTVAEKTPAETIEPEINSKSGEVEDVYRIIDNGYYLSTSRGEDLVKGLRTMSKLYNTIEKMVAILIERMKSIDEWTIDQEVLVAFHGHEYCQRKAFESLLNLEENVVVTNFEPGDWGGQFIKNLQNMAEKYGFPPSAPRVIRYTSNK